jgi:hypothetical protein
MQHTWLPRKSIGPSAGEGKADEEVTGGASDMPQWPQETSASNAATTGTNRKDGGVRDGVRQHVPK